MKSCSKSRQAALHLHPSAVCASSSFSSFCPSSPSFPLCLCQTASLEVRRHQEARCHHRLRHHQEARCRHRLQGVLCHRRARRLQGALQQVVRFRLHRQAHCRQEALEEALAASCRRSYYYLQRPVD